MFKNIGGKLKTYASVAFALGVIGSVYLGAFVAYNTIALGSLGASGLSLFLFILIVAIGIISSWFSSCLIYAFGELVDKTQEIANNTKKQFN